MNTLYNLGTRAYFAAIGLAARLGNRKARLMQDGRKGWEDALASAVQRLRQQDGADGGKTAQKPCIYWFHAASLGEFEQGRPLMEEMRRRYPDRRILLTFFSPSGYEVRKNYKGADIICYLPYDTRRNARRFLGIVEPETAIFIKYEFWGNMLRELDRRDIPTYLISGIFRRRQAFFRWYGGVLRPALNYFSRFFVQDDESRNLLTSLGYNNVTVCGDTRFDRVIAIQQQAKVLPWAEQFRNAGADHADNGTAPARFILVAGSSWPKDEEFLIDHFNRHPEMKLIIAPHEIHEEHIKSIQERLKRPSLRYSELAQQADGLPQVDCLIIDAIGFLSSIYRYGDVAYIGGGFGVGIHNTLEAAVYGIPVIFGPNHRKFREALGLIAAGGGFGITDGASYARTVDGFIKDREALREAGRRAGQYVQQNSGASDVIFAAL